MLTSMDSSTLSDEGSLWGYRVEQFLDQRGTTDATEIANGLTEAVTALAGNKEISVPIVDSPEMKLGTDVPIGAKVTAVVDGITLVERVRQITTTISGTAPSVSKTAVFGNPDAMQTPTQRKLAQALRRIAKMERLT